MDLSLKISNLLESRARINLNIALNICDNLFASFHDYAPLQSTRNESVEVLDLDFVP